MTSPLRPSRIEVWPRAFDPRFELDWSRPDYSRRLLLEHLDQSHDGASRRRRVVDQQVRRLKRLLPQPPARVLDAGCGPGLYALPLAQTGYDVTGIDVSPAALRFARSTARRKRVTRAHFESADLRVYTAPRDSFDAVLLVYYVLEPFQRRTQQAILRRLGETLSRRGRLIVEMRMRPDQLEGRVDWWDVVPRSILGDRRHLLLGDTTYDRRRSTYVLREIAVFDDGSVAAQQSTAWLCPWEQLPDFFRRAHLDVVAMYDGWSSRRANQLSESVVVVARPCVSRPDASAATAGARSRRRAAH